jgi:hypothetical protein
MKKHLLGIIAVAVIGVSFSGCTVNKATTKATNFDKKSIQIVKERPFDVLGPITLEKDWFGVLGVSLPELPALLPALPPIPPGDHYVYQKGGVTYVDLLTEAKTKYPDADAVIDINIDYAETRYFVFYAARKNIVSGIAIKYVKAASAVPAAIPTAPKLDWSFKSN